MPTDQHRGPSGPVRSTAHRDFATVRETVRSRDTLRETMIQVARSAQAELPTADGAGVTLMSGTAVLATACSVAFVVDVDALQYGLGEGPCVSAVAERRTFSTGTLGRGELRWPRFGAGAVQLGVHSVASFPLLLQTEVIGSINAYAFDEDAFEPADLTRGEVFAGTAALAVNNAQVLATTQLLQTQLRQSLDERAIVESAVGVLMFRGDISAIEAHDHLQQIAELHHLELPVVAQVILTDAAVWSGTARAVIGRAAGVGDTGVDDHQVGHHVGHHADGVSGAD